MKKTALEKSEIPSIKDLQTCRVTTCGNITEIMARTSHAKAPTYLRKVSNDNYIDTRTGEIFAYNHIENRADDLQTVAHSLSNLRNLLNANIIDTRKCRWLTLTYAENMTDTKKLYNDFKYFNTKCRAEYGHYEYIVAAEPQGRGAWHLHCVFIFEEKAPYMENAKIRELWGKGFVTVKKLENVDNVGAYLTAYLGDMELTDENKEKYALKQIKEVEYEENGEKKKKRFVKGARLCMYPPKFNIYRFSRGVKKPIIEEMSYKEAKEKVRGGAQTFSKAVKLDDDKGFTDTIIYEYYNEIRGKSQEEIEKNTSKHEIESAVTKLDEKPRASLNKIAEMKIMIYDEIWTREELKNASYSESHARAVLSEELNYSDFKEVNSDDDIWSYL